MSFMKDLIIEAEVEILERFWEQERYGIRDAFPDEPPSSIYDVQEVMGRAAGDGIYLAITETVYNDFCDRADNLRKRAKGPDVL